MTFERIILLMEIIATAIAGALLFAVSYLYCWVASWIMQLDSNIEWQLTVFGVAVLIAGLCMMLIARSYTKHLSAEHGYLLGVWVKRSP